MEGADTIALQADLMLLRSSAVSDVERQVAELSEKRKVIYCLPACLPTY